MAPTALEVAAPAAVSAEDSACTRQGNAEVLEELQTRPITLCPDQADWLLECARWRPDECRGCQGEPDGISAARAGKEVEGEAEGIEKASEEMSAKSSAFRRLIELANREPSGVKRQLFLIVRCPRCLQHTRGGDKHCYDISLPKMLWQWLEAVQDRSKHPTIGKTLRIIIDFYKPMCDKDPAFEDAIFGCLRRPSAPAKSEASTRAADSEDSPDGDALSPVSSPGSMGHIASAAHEGGADEAAGVSAA